MKEGQFNPTRNLKNGRLESPRATFPGKRKRWAAAMLGVMRAPRGTPMWPAVCGGAK